MIYVLAWRLTGSYFLPTEALKVPLLSEYVRLKQCSIANKLTSLLQQFNNVAYRHKLVRLFWYDRMLGAPLDDRLETIKKMNDEEFCFWLL